MTLFEKIDAVLTDLLKDARLDRYQPHKKRTILRKEYAKKISKALREWQKEQKKKEDEKKP
jgi:hypothetical protein